MLAKGKLVLQKEVIIDTHFIPRPKYSHALKYFVLNEDFMLKIFSICIFQRAGSFGFTYNPETTVLQSVFPGALAEEGFQLGKQISQILA